MALQLGTLENLAGKLKYLVSIVLSCLTILLGGCESGENNASAQKVRVEVIEPILVKHKICFDLKGCANKYNAHYQVSDGAAWIIYSMGNRQIINDIFSNMLVFTKQLPRNTTFSVSFYSIGEREVGFFDKPIAKLIIQGEQ